MMVIRSDVTSFETATTLLLRCNTAGIAALSVVVCKQQLAQVSLAGHVSPHNKYNSLSCLDMDPLLRSTMHSTIVELWIATRCDGDPSTMIATHIAS